VRLRAAWELDARALRTPGAVALGAAAALALLPGHAGIPCPLRTATGVPCPFCGTTTSAEDALRGHLGAAAAASPLGLLGIAVVAALVAFRPARVRVSPLALAVAVLGAWLFELHRFSFL
jgi:hypothetical protein